MCSMPTPRPARKLAHAFSIPMSSLSPIPAPDTAAIERDQASDHRGVVHRPDDRLENRPHAHDRIDRRDIAVAGGRQRREAEIEQRAGARRSATRLAEGCRYGNVDDLVSQGPEDAEQQ